MGSGRPTRDGMLLARRFPHPMVLAVEPCYGAGAVQPLLVFPLAVVGLVAFALVALPWPVRRVALALMALRGLSLLCRRRRRLGEVGVALALVAFGEVSLALVALALGPCRH